MGALEALAEVRIEQWALPQKNEPEALLMVYGGVDGVKKAQRG